MTELIMMATGSVYPLPVRENLTCSLDEYSDGSLDLNLTLAIPYPELEIEALKHPVRMSILTSAPVVWVIMSFGDSRFDAPYVIGLEHPHVVARIQRAIALKKGAAAERQAIRFALVDLDTRILVDLRFFYASATWMKNFATAVLQSPSHTPDEVRKASVARDYKRWPDIGRMIKDAAYSEVVQRE